MKKTGDLILIGIIAVIVIVCGVLIFTQKTFVVKFELNNGSTMDSVEVIRNEKLEKPTDPTREGYIFNGWSLDGKAYDFESEVKEDMTLNAEWAKISVPVEKVALNKTSTSIQVGKTFQLELTLTPDNTTDTATYESSKETVATVDENGLVTAVKKGTANITVKVGDITKKLKVTVK